MSLIAQLPLTDTSERYGGDSLQDRQNYSGGGATGRGAGQPAEGREEQALARYGLHLGTVSTDLTTCWITVLPAPNWARTSATNWPSQTDPAADSRHAPRHAETSPDHPQAIRHGGLLEYIGSLPLLSPPGRWIILCVLPSGRPS